MPLSPEQPVPADRLVSAVMPAEASEVRAADAERRRWRIIDKLRNRTIRRNLTEKQKDSLRRQHFQENYRLAAHFMIDIVASAYRDPAKRNARRARMEQIMRIPKSPRIWQKR